MEDAPQDHRRSPSIKQASTVSSNRLDVQTSPPALFAPVIVDGLRNVFDVGNAGEDKFRMGSIRGADPNRPDSQHPLDDPLFEGHVVRMPSRESTTTNR